MSDKLHAAQIHRAIGMTMAMDARKRVVGSAPAFSDEYGGTRYRYEGDLLYVVPGDSPPHVRGSMNHFIVDPMRVEVGMQWLQRHEREALTEALATRLRRA